ncbi:MAG TPA: hypothetical protein VG246_13195 [Acidimicrobiales bacterium]|jgi:hypothetical protein|nr:hypothetical protein [Acidimicrobiales bacterium]
MRTLLFILAGVLFVLLFFIALVGGTWDTLRHLFMLLGLGLALLAFAHVVHD